MRGVVIILLIGILTLSGCGNEQESVYEQAMEQGEQALQHKQYEKALAAFELAVENRSDQKAVASYKQVERLKEAWVLQNEGKLQEAAVILDELLATEDVLAGVAQQAKKVQEEVKQSLAQQADMEKQLAEVAALLQAKDFAAATERLESMQKEASSHLALQAYNERIAELLVSVHNEVAKAESVKKERAAVLSLKQRALFEDMTVKLPQGWEEKSTGGHGDWVGLELTNPEDRNESIVVIRSACVGCVMNQEKFLNGEFEVELVHLLPATVTEHFTFSGGLAIGYTFRDDSHTYEGNGVVRTNKATDGSGYDGDLGYGYIHVFLPVSKKELARDILNSFQFQ